jgi:hypothetical protein
MEISYVLNGLLGHSFSMVPIVSIVLLCLFTENISIKPVARDRESKDTSHYG